MANSYVASVIRDIGDVDSQKVEVVYAIAGNAEAPELRKVDDEMRRWIAENLLIGHPPASIADKMKTVGIPEYVALDEIRVASDSPYLRGALRLQNRLKKRDWILSVYSKLGRLKPGFERVDRRQKLSRNDFLIDYYTLNRPVIIDGMIDDWPARVDRASTNSNDALVIERSRFVCASMRSVGTFQFQATRDEALRHVADYVQMIRRPGTLAIFA